MNRVIGFACACLFLFGVAASCAERPRILGVAHIALFVSDIEKSRAFYKDFLGYQEPFSLNNSDGSLALTFIKINDEQYIELFPGLKPDADRLNHIGFYTDDIEALRVYLGERGIKVPERVTKGRIGTLNFMISDPDHHNVEFVQYAPGSWPVREKGSFVGALAVSPRMRHLGILVGNLDASMKFYGELLGFRETWRGSASTTLSWVNMKVPDGDDYIEFMLYKDLPAAAQRGVQHHICLETADVAKALTTLEGRPYRKTLSQMEGARTGRNGRQLSNLYDPDGTRVELMEPLRGAPPASSTALPPR